MFSVSKYYEYIKSLERTKIILYVIYGILGSIIGGLITAASGNGLTTLIGIGLGLLIANNQTLGIKIKIQKMYWEIEMYNKMNKIIEK